MNSDDFNFKYSKYLNEGHYGCDLGNKDAIDYLDKEFQELIKIPGFKFSQIKSKFHWFCFYCDNVPRTKVEEIEHNLKKIYEENKTI